jgi:hypothetical protein
MACCVELQEVSPAAFRTVGEPGLALFGASESPHVHDYVGNTLLPPTSARPTPCDCIRYAQHQICLGSTVFVLKRRAASDIARVLDEPLPIPPDERVILFQDEECLMLVGMVFNDSS